MMIRCALLWTEPWGRRRPWACGNRSQPEYRLHIRGDAVMATANSSTRSASPFTDNGASSCERGLPSSLDSRPPTASILSLLPLPIFLVNRRAGILTRPCLGGLPAIRSTTPPCGTGKPPTSGTAAQAAHRCAQTGTRHSPREHNNSLKTMYCPQIGRDHQLQSGAVAHMVNFCPCIR
jgi:hypothetical protein